MKSASLHINKCSWNDTIKISQAKVHIINTVSKGVCFTDPSIQKPSKLLGNHDCHQPRGSLVRSWILTGGQMTFKIKEKRFCNTVPSIIIQESTSDYLTPDKIDRTV